MAQELDVYQMVKGFAARNKISSFAYKIFSSALVRQARAGDQTNPMYRELSLHPEQVLIPKLLLLARDHKISLSMIGNEIESIMLPEEFVGPVRAEYQRMEESPDVPFPDESGLKISVPPEWLQTVSIETDLAPLLDSELEYAVPLFRLLFPEGLRSILLPSDAMGGKLLEYTILKIRHYLRKGSNKDYVQQRMLGAFPNKEMLLKEGISTVMIKPFDAIREITQGTSDFTYPFWAYLISSIKKDLQGKGEPTPDDVAAWQASYLMDVYNNYYKGKAQRLLDRDSAFKTLALLLRKAPYLFSMDEITDFRDGQGRPLLGKYTSGELEDWVRENTTRLKENALPDFLVIPSREGKSAIIAKDKLLPYALKLIGEARVLIRASIINDWREVLYNFGTLEAMNDDAVFQKDLESRLLLQTPALVHAISSGFLPLVYSEYHGGKDAPKELEACFGNNKVAPLPLLLGLARKQLLSDVRMVLPLWYTVPILCWLVKLFLQGGKKKSKPQAQKKVEPSAQAAKGAAPTSGRAAEFSQAARDAEKRLLPKGYTLEEYMGSLSNRWNTLLEPVSKANLTEDINSLVRDYLRGVLRNMRPSSFTVDRIENLASNLADRPNLMQIRNHAALEEYIKLYIIKLLKR